MVSGISVIKLFLTSTCLLSIFILSPVNTQCEEITIFRSTSLSQLFSIRIQLIAEGRFEFQYPPCIRPNCNSPENNPPTYTVRFLSFMNGLGRIHKTCEGMLMNGTTLSNSTTMIISKCVPPLLRPVTFNSNGISLSGCRYFDINIAQEAGNSLNAVPISYESCNENATICNQYCDNPSHFFVVNNEGKESGDEDTYKEGKVDVEDENGENDETAESITDDTESLSTQRLEDFCNCSYIRSLECTNPMNYTNLCSPHRRPFCEEFDVFNDNFCECLCVNVTQPCNIEGISLGRPEAEACTKLCLHISLSDSLSSVCVNQLIEKCEDLLNNSLLVLCDLTTPPEDLTAFIYNYFKIIFSLVKLEPINETLDNLEDFFENIERFEDCGTKIVTAFENQTIEIFNDIINHLLNKESITGTESFQKKLLEIIKDFSTLVLNKCPMETDMVYGLNWGFTSASQTSTQPCGTNFTGNASRVCGDNGIWLDPNVSSCLSIISASLQQISSRLLVGEYNRDNAQETLDSLTKLAEVTVPMGFSQFPLDLEVISEFLLNTVDYLLLGINQTNATEVLLMESFPFVEVLSNLVSTDNLPGAQQLMEKRPDSPFSQNLLHTAERYGLYLASLLEQNDGGNLTIVADNIIVNAKAVLIDDKLADIIFPSTQFTDEVNMTSRFSVLNRLNEVSVVIPASVLRERASMGSHARVSNIVYQNIEQFLPSNAITSRNISFILSSQVERQGGDSNQILPDPAVINFSFPNQILYSLNCVFFDFNNPPNVGSFSSDGITTEVIVQSGNGTSETIAQCTSNHLTSFAVLVNVGDHSSVSSDTALNVVSYIGLGVSLACLLVTIIFFLTFGKSLFSGVHNLVHLNLAIALFLAYLVFAIGVDLAAEDDTICKVVAALLQYLFLAVFCWMLCEGIMLYLMLVVVFSSLSKKWWLFFLLGWLPPLVFVAIGLTIFVNKDDGYGVYDHDQGVLLFCWMSSNNGAIWTFVGPMIAVIVINAVFLVLVLYSIIKSYRKKRKHIMKDKGIKVDLVITTVKASFILLPLLGLTWLFGVFAVNENTVIFAWIFTILNTLQGLFILIFHVLRHERIWGRFKKQYNIKQSTKPSNGDINKKLFTASTGSDKLQQSNPTANTLSQSEKVMETVDIKA